MNTLSGPNSRRNFMAGAASFAVVGLTLGCGTSATERAQAEYQDMVDDFYNDFDLDVSADVKVVPEAEVLRLRGRYSAAFTVTSKKPNSGTIYLHDDFVLNAASGFVEYAVRHEAVHPVGRTRLFADPIEIPGIGSFNEAHGFNLYGVNNRRPVLRLYEEAFANVVADRTSPRSYANAGPYFSASQLMDGFFDVQGLALQEVLDLKTGSNIEGFVALLAGVEVEEVGTEIIAPFTLAYTEQLV